MSSYVYKTPELSYSLVSVFNFLQILYGLQPVSHQPLHLFFPEYFCTLFKVRCEACAILTPFPGLQNIPAKGPLPYSALCISQTFLFKGETLRPIISWKNALTSLYRAV